MRKLKCSTFLQVRNVGLEEYFILAIGHENICVIALECHSVRKTLTTYF